MKKVTIHDLTPLVDGGEDRGQVNVLHKGNKWPAVRVIRESTGWKVDER